MTDNPWKKRKPGWREFMPPSRVLYAQDGGYVGTATWCYFKPNAVLPKGLWQCTSASKFLRWMRGSTQPDLQPQLLRNRGIAWHWIEPNTMKVLAPPF